MPLLFFLSAPHSSAVQTIDVILGRLIADAIAAGRFQNEAEFLKKAGKSTGYLGELRARVLKKPNAGLRADTAVKFAQLLGVHVTALTPRLDQPPEDDHEPYKERTWAVYAARALQLPEWAIQRVLAEDPGHDPGRLWWFLRIQTEKESPPPAAAKR